MAVREDLFRKAIAEMAGGNDRILSKADAEFSHWLTERRVPKVFVDFLIANSLASPIPVMDGEGEVLTPAMIVETNTNEPAILGDGFLQIARAMNGDPIVIDLNEGDGRIGFLSHDELWEPDPPPPRELFAPAAVGIGDFFYGVAFDEDFPPDYFAAQEMETPYRAPK